MFALFGEFVLQLQAGVIGLDSADGFDDCIDPVFQAPLAEILRCDGAITRIVIWKPCVPPDPSVEPGILQRFRDSLSENFRRNPIYMRGRSSTEPCGGEAR